MAEPPLDAKAILSQFDGLQGDGELFYAPTQPIVVEDHGLQFEFRVVPSFSSKPQLAASGEQAKTAQSAKRPPPTDGSDIDHSDPAFFIANVGNNDASPTHKLILNKFCVFRPQYLLLTTDASRKQREPLDRDDLFAAWQVLDELKSPHPHYVIYNCGREGGSSRSHKHMQVLQLPQPHDGSRTLHWPHSEVSRHLRGDVNIATQSGSVKTLPLPYLVCYEPLRADSKDMLEHLLSSYKSHLDFCERAVETLAESRIPHNVILTREWILTIPRTHASTEGIQGHIVNATGMLGLVWSSNDAQLEGWRQAGPVSILQRLGIPNV